MENNCSVLWLQDQSRGTEPTSSEVAPTYATPLAGTIATPDDEQDQPHLTPSQTLCGPPPTAIGFFLWRPVNRKNGLTQPEAATASPALDAPSSPSAGDDAGAEPSSANADKANLQTASSQAAPQDPEPPLDPSVPLAPPTPTISTPSSQDLQLRQHIAQFGWPTVHQLRDQCTTLNSYCCVCHQWLADPTQLKVHFQRIHRDLWERYNTDTTQACELLRAVMTSPCIYCHRDVVRPNLHASKCTVTWQACMLKHIWELQDVPGQYTLRLPGPPPQANAKAKAQIQRRRQEKEQQISQATGLPIKHSKPTNFFCNRSPAPSARPSTPVSNDQQSPEPRASMHAGVNAPVPGPRDSAHAQVYDLLRDTHWVQRACAQCPLCSHLLKDTAGMRRHMRSTHASFWSRMQNLAIPASILDQAASPCQWCQARTKRPRNHVQSCQPVLLALAIAVQTGDSDGGVGSGTGATGDVQRHAPLTGRPDAPIDGSGRRTGIRRDELPTANPNPPPAMPTSTPPNFVPGSLTAGAHKRPIATPQTQASRQNTRGAKGKGTGRGSHRGRGNPPWGQQPTSLHTEFGPDMQSWLQSPEALHHLIRLVMRHEHQLMRLGQDTTLLFTFANRPHQVENLLPHLYHISRAWKEKMDSDQLDRRPKMSLRVTVLQSVILEVRTRTRAILQRQECQAPLVKKGWLQEQSWTYLRWDAAQQDLVPQPTRSSMSRRISNAYWRSYRRTSVRRVLCSVFRLTASWRRK